MSDVMELLLHRERCPASPFGRAATDILGPCNCGVVQVAEKIRRLRSELERLAIRGVVFKQHGPFPDPEGSRCDLCGGEWQENYEPRHAPDCALNGV